MYIDNQTKQNFILIFVNFLEIKGSFVHIFSNLFLNEKIKIKNIFKNKF